MQAYKNTPPSSAGIFIVILLGALGLLGTLTYLTHDLKITSYSQQRWAVISAPDKLGKTSLIDTMQVQVHPNISIHKPYGASAKPDVSIPFDKIYMTYVPALLIWMALISVTVAVALALLPVIIKSIRDVYFLSALKPRHLISAIVIAVVIGYFIALTNNNPHLLMLFDIMKAGQVMLQHPKWLNGLILICLAVGLVAMTGQLLINHAVSLLPDSIQDLSAEKQKQAANHFKYLHKTLKFFLMVDAVLIVFSILTTDTLRRALLQELLFANADKHDIFPKEFVYLYGMVFTLYLALFYLPIYYRLKYKGETMVQVIPQSSAVSADDFLIKESAADSFKVALSILAPIVSSLLPGLLKL